ncbi:MAG: oxidoreductase [Hyphomicrobiales bacterium]|nr:MAG: oxidoreductase [Hyphomicrobiales bacterium]
MVDSMSGAPRKVVVQDRLVEADGVVSLVLVDEAGGALPDWSPGAHIDVHLGSDLIRQYSLCGRPEDTLSYRIGILREPGGRGGSEALHDKVAVGDRLQITGPRNHFELVDAPSYLFVAGGIGITPILPMIAHVHSLRADWRLLYGGRTRASMAFVAELEAYGDRVQVVPQDESGLLNLRSAFTGMHPQAETYCCGPEPLIAAVREVHPHRSSGRLRFERFGKTVDVVDGRGEHRFDVHLARSGVTVEVPVGRTILECVRASGIEASSSCEEGICGECETTVLGGIPDHRDSVLDDAERSGGATMMICCSRAMGDELVLDL